MNASSLIFVEQLSAPAVAISLNGDDSLLVYTQENILYHFIITASSTTVRLIQMGQIGLHGIVRAPARVRAVTWYIPDYQLREQANHPFIYMLTMLIVDGDPSQDVVQASVIFLVDAKLVLLQPSNSDDGALKYDMRIIANDVEYFVLTRDQNFSSITAENTQPQSTIEYGTDSVQAETGLKDSLWYFDGQQVQCWTDIQELLKITSLEETKDSSSPISIPTDFYPTSIVLNKGIIIGVEPDLVQRRDAHFALFRFIIRVCLVRFVLDGVANSFSKDTTILASNTPSLFIYSRLFSSLKSFLSLPTTSLFFSCPRGFTSYGLRCRSRVIICTSRILTAFSSLFSLIFPRLPRHSCAVHSQNRNALLAHIVCIFTTSSRALR